MVSRSAGEDGLGSFAGGVLMILIVVTVAAIWLTVKAVNLVLRVLVRHPRNRAMWIALGISLFLVILVFVTGGAEQVVNGLALASLLGTVITARAVELYHDELLQPELSRGYVIDQVLHQPWWSLEAA